MIISDEMILAKPVEQRMDHLMMKQMLEQNGLEGEYEINSMADAHNGWIGAVWNANKKKGIPAVVMYEHYLGIEKEWSEKSLVIEAKEFN